MSILLISYLSIVVGGAVYTYSFNTNQHTSDITMTENPPLLPFPPKHRRSFVPYLEAALRASAISSGLKLLLRQKRSWWLVH